MNPTPPQATVTGSVGGTVLAVAEFNPYITAIAGLLAIVCSGIFIYDRFFGKNKK
jgi:hypothetical protein